MKALSLSLGLLLTIPAFAQVPPTLSANSNNLPKEPDGIYQEGLQTNLSNESLKEISSWVRGVRSKLNRLKQTLRETMTDDIKNRIYQQTFKEIVVEAHKNYDEKIIRISINRTLHINQLIDNERIINGENLKQLAFKATHQLIEQYLNLLKIEDGADLALQQLTQQPLARFGRDYAIMLNDILNETRALYFEHDVRRLILEWLHVDLESDSVFRQNYFAQIKSIHESLKMYEHLSSENRSTSAGPINVREFYLVIAAYKQELSASLSALNINPPIR